MKFCVACKRKMIRLSKLQLAYRGYCTPCIKEDSREKKYNHYTGKTCEPEEVMDVPEDQKLYHIKDIRNNVIVVFS